MNNEITKKKIELHRGLKKKDVYKKIGEYSYEIRTECTYTFIMPRWFRRLITTKRLRVSTIEADIRLLKAKLEKINTKVISVSPYSEDAHIITAFTVNDRYKNNKGEIKVILRLLQKAYKEFLSPYRKEVETLSEYKVSNNKIIYCPVGPRKRVSLFLTL